MTTTTATGQLNHTDAPRIWTIDAIRGLGATIDVETAGAILGIGRSKSYELAKANEFRCNVTENVYTKQTAIASVEHEL